MTENMPQYPVPAGSIKVMTSGNSTIYQLTYPETTIGRGSDNDVVLNDPAASRYHAKLVHKDSRWQIIDVGSSNGTQLNGARLSPETYYPVNDRDVIDICESSILISFTGADVPQSAKVVIKDDKNKLSSKISVEHSGIKEIHRLLSQATKVGSDANNEVVLDDPSVSPNHARLEFRNSDTFLIDLNSVSGTYVNGSKLLPNVPQMLKPGDIIEIGQYKISLIRDDVLSDATSTAVQKKIELGSQTILSVGRSSSNDLVLPYPAVSRKHACLFWDEHVATHIIEDLHSTNGTFVNGKLISNSALLHPGDIVQIGPVSLAYGPGFIQTIDKSKDIEVRTSELNQFISQDRNLLQNISLTIKPREFVAIVGTSGAGKSTLLNALSGFRPANSGTVYVNGQDLYANFDAFRDQIGFVPQSNIIHLELTVYEALYYSARLRLPSDTTDSERANRIDDVLETLGIAHCKNQPVSSLSGGEQKRVSMGVELLTQPGLFFLDEATSGLDPGTESDIMSLLRELADKGHTIIIVTHATKNIAMCHRVIFMNKGGYVAFVGTPEDALKYFEVNDFDQIYTILKKTDPSTSADEFAKSKFDGLHGSGEGALPAGAASESRVNRQSPGSSSKRVSLLGQLSILTLRNLSILRRDGRNLGLTLLISPIIGLLFFLFWRWGLFDPLTGNARFIITNLFMIAMVCCLVGTLLSMREIVKEVEIYKRERVVVLKIVPYIGSKFLIAALISLYTSLVFMIFLELSGAWPPPSQIVAVFVTLFLSVLSGCAMGLFISALSTNQNVTPLLLVLFLVLQLIFGGIVPVTQIGPVGKVIGYATSTKWTFESLVKVSGMGDEIAADPYWNLPENQREAMTEEEKLLKCKYMGPNLFLNCHFPGILKYRVGELSMPEPQQPQLADRTFAEPGAPPSPPFFPKQTDIAEWQQQIKIWAEVDFEKWSDNVTDYEKQMKDYKAEVTNYRDYTVKDWQKTYEKWKEKRSKAIGEAEGTIKAIYDDYKLAFNANVIVNWIVLLAMIFIFMGAIAILMRVKDRS